MNSKLIIIIFILALPLISIAQSDKEFWFVAPESSSAHADRPILLRISAGALASTVTIEMPANTAGFNSGSPIIINIPANTAFSQDLTPWIDIIENGTPVSNVVENKGIRITATENITVYYDEMGIKGVSAVANPEIFSLKGAHALGKKFYTPFQNLLPNGYGNSAFDIVATENNTTVTITPTKAMVGHAAGVAYTIVLNKGQTYSGQALATTGVGHLSGTLITSDKNIAVTIKDDSVVQGGSRDLVGDQMVPVNLLGTNYIVVKGLLNIPDTNTGDRAIICATENGTTVTIGGVLKATLNAGQVYNYQVTLKSEYIETSHPAYVYHISGFGNELGGALLPPIVCTGSRKVSIFRDTDEPFYLNFLVKNGGQNSFTIKNNTTGVTLAVPAAAFSVVVGTPVAGDWYSAQILYSKTDFPTASNSVISNGAADFHLALINGAANTGCRYGYFSDFGSVNAGTASALTPICYNTSDTINLVGSAGSIQWQSSPDGLAWSNVVGGSGATTTPYITPNLTSKTYYRAEVTKGTCLAYSDTLTIDVNPPIIAGTVSSDDTVCSGSNSGVLTLAGNTAPVIRWESSTNNFGTGTITIVPNITTSLIYTNITATTKYRAVVQTASCPAISSSATITVDTLSGLLFKSASVCVGKDTVFIAPPGMTIYSWSGPSSFSSNNDTIAVSVPGLYISTITNGVGCTRTDTAILSLSVLTPDLGKDVILCGADSLVLSSGIANSTYLWTPGSATTPSLTAKATGEYSVKVTNGFGCVANDTISLQFNDIPMLDLGTDTSLCVKSKEEIVLKANYNNGNPIKWSSGDSNLVSIKVSAIGVYWAKVDSNGCSTTKTIQVSDHCEDIILQWPNVMTPNGDNKDDYFKAMKSDGIIYEKYFSSMRTEIVDRWGILVYSAEGSLPKWDGKINGGAEVSSGTYYWVVKYTFLNGKSQTDAGYVSVLR